MQECLSQSSKSCNDQPCEINILNSLLKAERADLEMAQRKVTQAQADQRQINRLNSLLKAERADLETAQRKVKQAQADVKQANAEKEAAQKAALLATRDKDAAVELATEAIAGAQRYNAQAQAQAQQQQHQATSHPSLLQAAESALNHKACGTRMNISKGLGEFHRIRCPSCSATLHDEAAGAASHKALCVEDQVACFTVPYVYCV